MFGYHPDPPGHRYSRWLHAFRAPTVAPRDLRPFACKVLDQGQSSSCTGHGTATGVFTAAAAAGAPLGWIPSPCGIYTLAVALERGDPLKGPLQDAGAEPNQVARALTEFGIRPMRDQSAATDCFPANGVLAEPTLDELESEGEHCYVGWYEIANADEARIAIAAGAPVGIGTFVDSHFMQWDPSKAPLGRMNTSDPNGGGHWTVLLAAGPAGAPFVLRNSWGTSWGDAGDALVTDDFVNQADQLLAFGYKRIGAPT